MIELLVALISFAIVPYLLMSILSLIKTFIKQDIQRRMRVRNNREEPKETVLYKVNSSMKFIMKEDKRKTFGVQNKFIVIGLYVMFGAVTLFYAAQSNILMTSVMVLSPYIIWIVAYTLYRPIKIGRDSLYTKLYGFKSEKMGLVEKREKGRGVDYHSEFEITEWADNYITPTKMKMYIPTKFDELQIDGFMTHLSVHFGRKSKWTADRSNPEDSGWNFTEGHVNLIWTPHLPNIAMWDEKYLFDERIAWSFFPMGLGSENGVRLTDEEGNDEYVLGFDLAGEQQKLSRKQGTQLGTEVVLAPQVLIAGGTGGGKALSTDTKIQRFVK